MFHSFTDLTAYGFSMIAQLMKLNIEPSGVGRRIIMLILIMLELTWKITGANSYWITSRQGRKVVRQYRIRLVNSTRLKNQERRPYSPSSSYETFYRTY